MSDREVIRCTHCKLVMFRSQRNQCPRCLTVLGYKPEMLVVASPRPAPAPRVYQTIGERVRAIRKRSRISQREFARLLSKRRQWISKLENGHNEPTAHTAVRLAAALQCDISELFPAFHATVRQEDSALTDFMAELCAHLPMLDGEQMVAVRRRAHAMVKAKCNQVVIVNGVAGKESCA